MYFVIFYIIFTRLIPSEKKERTTHFCFYLLAEVEISTCDIYYLWLIAPITIVNIFIMRRFYRRMATHMNIVITSHVLHEDQANRNDREQYEFNLFLLWFRSVFFQLYLDFEDAFQDECANDDDYFGFQPTEPASHQPNNFHLQSVEMISEVSNRNFSPNLRYQASRETSHSSSTTSDPRLAYLHRDFTHLNLNRSNNNNHHHHHHHSPAPFTPDAVRFLVQKQESNPTNLPQYFLVKYLGRSLCSQLWGAKAVRTPIDDMVRNARQLSSMNDVPTLEICVSTRGLTLTHRHAPPVSSNHHRSRFQSPERHQHGLIPLENISYAMHDVKYSKIASCIVLRQAKLANDEQKTVATETLTECYAFLFQTKDYAHRFALALAEAFNAHKQSTRVSRTNHNEKRDRRSPQRRSKSKHHHHHRTRSPDKYRNHHLKDSKA